MKKERVVTKHSDITQLQTPCESILYCNHLARHSTTEAVDYILRLAVRRRAICTWCSWIFTVQLIADIDLDILPEKPAAYKNTVFRIITANLVDIIAALIC